MNLIYENLFYFKTRNLEQDILNFLLPETKKNEKEMFQLSKKLEDIKKIYEKVNWKEEPIIENLFLLMYESKKNYLIQNYEEAKKNAFEVKRKVISLNSDLTEFGKNNFLFNAEMIELKCLIDKWSLKVNEEYNNFYQIFLSEANEVLEVGKNIMKIKNKRSEEYIELSKNYMSLLYRTNIMREKKIKGLIISDENKKEGQILLDKLNYFEEKIKKFKHNTLNFTYSILLEKIKLECYISEDKQKNFNLMCDFCSLCLKNSIKDPVYAALENFRKNRYKNNSFKDYLYTFSLEVFEDKHKIFVFKLKKGELVLLDEEDRIKIKKVKSVENINEKI